MVHAIIGELLWGAIVALMIMVIFPPSIPAAFALGVCVGMVVCSVITHLTERRS